MPTMEIEELRGRKRQPLIKKHGGLFCASDVRILIVDDDRGGLPVIQAALARKDFLVEAVSDRCSSRIDCAISPISHHPRLCHTRPAVGAECSVGSASISPTRASSSSRFSVRGQAPLTVCERERMIT